MTQKQLIKSIRPQLGKPAAVLLLYLVFLNRTVPSFGDLAGWGYVITCTAGAICFCSWIGKEQTIQVLTGARKKMRLQTLAVILCAFLSCQVISEIGQWIYDWAILRMGGDMGSHSGSAVHDDVGMFVYVGLFAPITEEIIFRGAIMYKLRPYGKKFAILASALLFSLFHTNFVQIPFAFFAGLVLGYVAAEYSLGWSVGLHVFNNLIIAQLLPMVTDQLPVLWRIGIMETIPWGALCASIIILVTHRARAAEYIFTSRIHPVSARAFFSSKMTILYIAATLLLAWFSMVFSLL